MSVGSLGSGGTLDQYINQLLQLERQPAVKLESSRNLIDQKQAVLTDIASKLTDLRTALSGLKSGGALSSLHVFTVSTSDSDVVTATADADATAGSHLLRVSGLARAHTLASGGFVSSESTLAEGSYSFDLTVAGVTTQVNVAIQAGDTNADALKRIASAVNLSGAKVSASVVTSDAATGTQKILLSSEETGTANLIADISDVSGTLAATLGIAGTSSTSAYSAATTLQASDATFSLDGLDLSASSNEVTGILAGVTLDLKSLSADTDVTLKILPDTDAGKTQVQAFIDSFNAALDFVRSKLSTADKAEDRGILAGSTAFQILMNDLRSATNRSVAGQDSDLARLADLGISFDRSGKLTLADPAKLETALSTDQNQVENLFGSTDGVAARLDTILKGFLDTNGALEQERNLLTSQSKLLTQRIQRIDDQLAIREKTLRAQFGRLVELSTQLSAQQGQLSAYGTGSGF